MLVVIRALFLASFCAFYSSPTEGSTLPLRMTDGRQRPCPSPPLRTLPDLNAIHGDTGTFRPDRQFLREWCPPEVPVVFPSRPTSTTIWGRDVARRFNGPTRTNPHRGAAVEGGGIRVTFPGQHITAAPPDSSSEEDENLMEFINSKMHPSLLRPMTQPLRPMAQPLRPMTQPLRPMTQPLRPMTQPLRPMTQPLRPTQPLVAGRGASEGEWFSLTGRMGNL